MPELEKRGCLADSGLRWIYFPRVHVEQIPVLLFQDGSDALVKYNIRYEPEVAATPPGQQIIINS